MEQRSRIRLIAAGTIGNVLERYDFAPETSPRVSHR
jgi:hypothetical protein